MRFGVHLACLALDNKKKTNKDFAGYARIRQCFLFCFVFGIFNAQYEMIA